MWIGFSVITVVEVLEFFLELFFYMYYHGKKEGERRKRRMGKARMMHHMQVRFRMLFVRKQTEEQNMPTDTVTRLAYHAVRDALFICTFPHTSVQALTLLLFRTL